MAYRVFFSPKYPQYTLMVYKLVSDAPSITAAVLPCTLSTPQVRIMSCPSASPPLPLIGLSKSSVVHSSGMPVSCNSGRHACPIRSTNPDTRSMRTAVRMTIMVGKMCSAVRSPFSTPHSSVGKRSTRRYRAYPAVHARISGRNKSVIRFPCALVCGQTAALPSSQQQPSRSTRPILPA